jgi:two-component system NtrC family sensor kinase
MRQRGGSEQPVKGRRANRPKARAIAARSIADLQKQVRILTRELKEAREQQTATAKVLQVINSSPGDLAPVFATILEKAHSLCAVAQGALFLYDGEKFRAVALRGLSEALAARLREGVVLSPNLPHRRLLEGARFAQVTDWAEIDDPIARASLGAGLRTTLFIPLRREGKLLGYIGASRSEVRPFSEKEIGLLESFAAQAVIAMENARLLDEIRHRNDELAETLEFQTATGEVLRIVASSPDDLQPVFDAMLEKAIALCEAKFGSLFLYDGNGFTVAADRNLPPAYAQAVRRRCFSTNAGFRRLVESKAPVHITDMFADGSYARGEPLRIAALELGGVRSLVAVPLLKKGELIGCFSIYRDEPGGFAENRIALATTFADQAVIAIENARLFDELRDRQAELRVTFDNMGDGVVMFDAAARLTAWNRNFQEILDLPDAFLAQRPSYADYFRYLAERGEYSADLGAELSRTLDDTSRELRFERTRPDGRVIEVRRNPVPGGGFVLIYADITERKHAEQAIRAARDAAQTALRELQKTQASLVHAQKMAALGQLTAGIAHEIKNPLNFVNNFAGLSVELLEELKGVAAEAIGTLDAGKRTEILETIGMLTGNLEKIAEHGRRADGIVRGMLQHSRGSSGDWQATDLNALAEESLNLAYHGARAQDQDFKVTLELDLDRSLAPIEVVSQDVSRVFLNLISNSFYSVTERSRAGDGAFHPLLKIATREFGEGRRA